MLTDKQIIDAAKDAGFIIYEDDKMQYLSPYLTAFARRIEQLCNGGQKKTLVAKIPPSAA